MENKETKEIRKVDGMKVLITEYETAIAATRQQSLLSRISGEHPDAFVLMYCQKVQNTTLRPDNGGAYTSLAYDAEIRYREDDGITREYFYREGRFIGYSLKVTPVTRWNVVTV